MQSRLCNNGEIVDIQEALKAAEAKIASFSESGKGITAVVDDLQIFSGSIDPAEPAEKLFVLGQASGKATPIFKHLYD